MINVYIQVCFKIIANKEMCLLSNLTNMGNYQTLKVVGRGSEI